MMEGSQSHHQISSVFSDGLLTVLIKCFLLGFDFSFEKPNPFFFSLFFWIIELFFVKSQMVITYDCRKRYFDTYFVVKSE